MANRNPDFPLSFDMYFGRRWLSNVLQSLNLSIPNQILLRHHLFVICHGYYCAYLGVQRGLFLNLHDLDNICLLFDSVRSNLSQFLRRSQVFLLYSFIVGVHGNTELPEAIRNWLDARMAFLNLQPSPMLPIDHPSFQVAPF